MGRLYAATKAVPATAKQRDSSLRCASFRMTRGRRGGGGSKFAGNGGRNLKNKVVIAAFSHYNTACLLCGA